MYSTLEKYTFDRRKTVGGEPVIERFGLTKNRKKKNTRSNSRKDSRVKKRSRSKSKRKSRSPRVESSQKKSSSNIESVSPQRPRVAKTDTKAVNSKPAANAQPIPSNTQKVNVSIDKEPDNSYCSDCGNQYWDDGYLGPGGFIYRYPPPWNYMDSINPGFYYPDPLLPCQNDYYVEQPGTQCDSAPITNSINIFSGIEHEPSSSTNVLPKDDKEITKSLIPTPNPPLTDYDEKSRNSEVQQKPHTTGHEFKKSHEMHEKAESYQDDQENSTEEFPSEPVQCGGNTAVVTTLIILGIIVLIAIVLAFLSVRKSRRTQTLL